MEAPEVPLEAAQEHIHEHAHGHGHEGGTKARWILGVALTSAVVAALAAVASLKAGHHANEALISQIDANNQILKASDQWALYQAKGVKLAVLQSKIDTLKALKPTANAEQRTTAAPEPAATPAAEHDPVAPPVAEHGPAATETKHEGGENAAKKEANGEKPAGEAKHEGGGNDKAAKKKETDEEKAKRYEKEQDAISDKAHEFEEKAEGLKKEGEEHLEHHVGLAKSVTMFQICIAVAAVSVLTNRRLFWFVSLLFAAYGVYAMVMGIMY